MAAGDNWFDCSDQRHNLTTEQTLRKLIYDDGNGNPVLHTDPDGTALDPFNFCDGDKRLNLEQVFRAMILEDADGNPYLNTTSS